MNWITIEKTVLVKAVDILNMVPVVAGVPSSNYIRVMIRKNDIEMSMSSSVVGVVRVPAIGISRETFFVDRRLFIPFVLAGKKWKGDFRSNFSENKWALRQGSRRAEFALRTDDIAGYGEWVDYKGLQEIKLSEELRGLLLTANTCAAMDASLPQLNCVYINGGLVLSCNSIVMFVGTSKKENGLKFPFPVGLVPLLGDGLLEAVGIEGDNVIFDCGCGFLKGTVSAIAKESFPKKQLVVTTTKAKEWPIIAKLPAERFSKMVGRLSEYLSNVRREDWFLRMEMGDGVVKAIVNVGQGKFEETLAVEDLKKEGVVEWPLELVRPVLEYMGQNAETIRVRVDEEKKTPYLISGAGVELMVARRKA